MKKQNTAVRRAALAVLYLAVFAAAVMYLRVTISVPAEGDDKLTLNGWLYDMGRMSFWQYALQDLKERLSFFLLKQVRFFPFHYPNAVALLFYRTLASYRLYIIAMTGAAAFLVSRVAAKLSRSNALALGTFGLALAAAPIFNEGMYSYYAVPQRTLLWAAASWLCLFYLHESHHRAWGVAAAVLFLYAVRTKLGVAGGKNAPRLTRAEKAALTRAQRAGAFLRSFGVEIVAGVIFTAIAYACGCAQYMVVGQVDLATAFLVAVAPFVVVDFCKIVAAVICADAVRAAVR